MNIEYHLPDGDRATGLDYRALGSRTEGYSGADIVSLCKEAAMRPVRRLMARINAADQRNEDEDLSEMKLDLVTRDDLDAAIACVRPSAAPKFLARYDKWASEFGSGYSAPSDNDAPNASSSSSS
jgi:katanin p60 ATPase-containing subunit A1